MKPRLCQCGKPVETKQGGFEYALCYDCWHNGDSRHVAQSRGLNHCKACGIQIPLNNVQQGLKLPDGQWLTFHIGCLDQWYNKRITVWKVEANGSSYLEEDFRQVSAMLQDMDSESSYTITKKEILQGDYVKLPEFRGF